FRSLLGVRQRVTSGYTSCHAAAPVGGVRSPRNDKSRRLRSELTAAEERRADMMALRKRGFTMIELAIVLVIAGLLTAMGAPKLAAAFRQRSVSSAGDQFAVSSPAITSTIASSIIESGRAHV